MNTSNRWVIPIADVFLQIALGAVYAWSVFRDSTINREKGGEDHEHKFDNC
jgi:hypothetical protein